MTSDTTTIVSPGSRNGERLIGLMGQVNCDLTEGGGRRNLLLGHCPFHRLPGRKSLTVEPRSAHFWCSACGLHGDVNTFAAMIWGVAITEAHDLLANMNGETPTVKRPRPMALSAAEQKLDRRFRKQNTNLLTLAARYYSNNLSGQNQGIHYLNALGLRPREARKAGFGFATGRGLAQWLSGRGCTRQEIADSPLFRLNRQERRVEEYSNVLLFPDLDAIQANKWFLILPTRTRHALDENRLPTTLSLPGQRPYVLGLGQITRNAPYLTVTDDPRIYLILKTLREPCIYAAPRTDGRNVASKLAARSPATVGIAIRTKPLGDAIEDQIRSTELIRDGDRWSIEDINDLIRPDARNAVMGRRIPNTDPALDDECNEPIH